jgi:hypothetical protein
MARDGCTGSRLDGRVRDRPGRTEVLRGVVPSATRAFCCVARYASGEGIVMRTDQRMGICEMCGREIALRPSGVLRMHTPPIEEDVATAVFRCPGSGLPPVSPPAPSLPRRRLAS